MKLSPAVSYERFAQIKNSPLVVAGRGDGCLWGFPLRTDPQSVVQFAHLKEPRSNESLAECETSSFEPSHVLMCNDFIIEPDLSSLQMGVDVFSIASPQTALILRGDQPELLVHGSAGTFLLNLRSGEALRRTAPPVAVVRRFRIGVPDGCEAVQWVFQSWARDSITRSER